MTHTVREKQKLLARVRRIRGQVAAVRGATAGLMAEVVGDHVRHHLFDPEKHPGALDEEAADLSLPWSGRCGAGPHRPPRPPPRTQRREPA
ncbi:hypothetical protein [Roseomonas chloroacetimidivorans]|uniref:hypothetical protein n=1 Tax=Roseomonas chloroacetimidivorans TaxID=1766656 RepID=UPI003C766F88